MDKFNSFPGLVVICAERQNNCLALLCGMMHEVGLPRPGAVFKLGGSDWIVSEARRKRPKSNGRFPFEARLMLEPK